MGPSILGVDPVVNTIFTAGQINRPDNNIRSEVFASVKRAHRSRIIVLKHYECSVSIPAWDHCGGQLNAHAPILIESSGAVTISTPWSRWIHLLALLPLFGRINKYSYLVTYWSNDRHGSIDDEVKVNMCGIGWFFSNASQIRHPSIPVGRYTNIL